jgi:hypothetical protein
MYNSILNQVSVFLESHENVEAEFAAKTKQHIANHSRICYAESHQNTLNSKRISISLNIPPKATPDFTCTAGK